MPPGPNRHCLLRIRFEFTNRTFGDDIYSQGFADTSMADVHVTKRRLPLIDTIQRLFLLMPQQPDELVFASLAETFIQLKTVQQLAIFVAELTASFHDIQHAQEFIFSTITEH